MQQLTAREEDVEMEGNFIEQSGTQFCVRSHNTGDQNFGCYPSREEAEAKLRTIMGTKLEAESGWQYGRRMPVGYIPKRTTSGFPANRGTGSRLPNPSLSRGRLEAENARVGESSWDVGKQPMIGVPRKTMSGFPKRSSGLGLTRVNPTVKSFADYGEPMAGTMSHSHIDPTVWFHPPSLTSRYKNEDLRIPTDNPREKNDKFLDVTKRTSKETNEQRMKMLKRASPGPTVGVKTTGVASHTGTYNPSALFASSRPARTKQGRIFVSYKRRGVL